ncbi:MAG: superoxide dismutase [Gammaproteobacteria bacterium]|nr:superoxide dismutase [Gammaproteobacteria bacterium]MDE0259377.1 superoxide dismutase [Gammaproteobacteria bacterium]
MAYPHELPDLGYDYDALEPHIDARTMEIHHSKHHAAYTANLNAALKSHPGLQDRSVEDLLGNMGDVPEAIRGAVRNNGGGYVNHALFWDLMTPGGADAPSGDLAYAIEAAFGSVDELKSRVNTAAITRFGSGWGWVVATDSGLAVRSTANQDSPLMDGQTPILGVDVWEHAYYLRYQNRRPDYLTAWWSTVNWDVVAANFAAAG